MSTVMPFCKWLKEQSANYECLFLTEEEIRVFAQFQNATEEEIENIINTLHALALITYEIFCKETGNDIIALAA